MSKSQIPQDRVLNIVKANPGADIAAVMGALVKGGFTYPDKTPRVDESGKDAPDPFMDDLGRTLASMTEAGQIACDDEGGKNRYRIPEMKEKADEAKIKDK